MKKFGPMTGILDPMAVGSAIPRKKDGGVTPRRRLRLKAMGPDILTAPCTRIFKPAFGDESSLVFFLLSTPNSFLRQ